MWDFPWSSLSFPFSFLSRSPSPPPLSLPFSLFSTLACYIDLLFIVWQPPCVEYEGMCTDTITCTWSTRINARNGHMYVRARARAHAHMYKMVVEMDGVSRAKYSSIWDAHCGVRNGTSCVCDVSLRGTAHSLRDITSNKVCVPPFSKGCWALYFPARILWYKFRQYGLIMRNIKKIYAWIEKKIWVARSIT